MCSLCHALLHRDFSGIDEYLNAMKRRTDICLLQVGKKNHFFNVHVFKYKSSVMIRKWVILLLLKKHAKLINVHYDLIHEFMS